jgi:hypothetical protein
MCFCPRVERAITTASPATATTADASVRFAPDAMLDEDGEIWDSTATLIAWGSSGVR